MRISKETLSLMEKQIELDCNTSEAEQINDVISIAPTKILEGSRIINKLDPFFRVIIFMGKAYIMSDEEMIPGWADILKDSSADWFFNYGHLRKIDYILQEFDREIVDTHIFFLPDMDFEKKNVSEDYIWLGENEIEKNRENRIFKNALCYSPTQPDYIAVAAAVDCNKGIYDENGFLVHGSMKGMSGASIDGKYVRQIGIDVATDYRNQGIAVDLVTALKQRIIENGDLPFYGTSESHSLSRLVGVKSGFLPAFAELFVAKKDTKF